jgi:hypothetical protein
MPSLAPKQTTVDFGRIVFIFFTILYQLNTLMFLSRIEHKSPVHGQFCQVFS